MSATDDHYAALGVAADASLEEIREAWRLRVVAFHPDRFRDEGQREAAERLSQQANAAWQTLSNPALRARHDRLRRARPAPNGAPPRPAGPPLRHLPCAGCATRVGTPDARGQTVALTCPACGLNFSAIVGGRTWGRAHLIRRGMSIHHEIDFAEPDGGGVHAVRFRRLPPELALADGEVLSVVFHPRNGRPVYAVIHHESMDLAWRVR